MIAEHFTTGKPLSVRQVSRKYLNEANKPDAYEEKMLAQMEAHPTEWQDRDWNEKVVENGQVTMRYMRPLVATESCLTCHGTPEEVPAVFQQNYNSDLAAGYELGDIRGAMSVAWPTRAKNAEEYRTEALAARAMFDETLKALLNGGPAPMGDERPILPACREEHIRAELQKVGELWERFNASVDVVMAEKAQESKAFLPSLNIVLTQNTTLLAEMNKVVGLMQESSEARSALMQNTQYAALGLALVVFAVAAVYVRARVTGPINRLIEGLNAGADQVHDAASEVSSASQRIAQGASEQSAALQQSSRALGEVAGTTRANAGRAQEASELSAQARTAAEHGDQTMARLDTAMTAINESSGQISKIIKVIEEIAFQTNLLALNAAVEAARAGEHGKGFAVVADEVRNLAQRAAQAAGDTTGLIQDSIGKTKEGAEVAGEVAQALGTMVGDVNKITDLINAIAQASQEQAQGVDQVNRGVSEMDKVTELNASGAEELASASEELNAQSATLKGMMDGLAAIVSGQGEPRTVNAGGATL
ncbi:MAG: methyl-accepting chemotaxis protein [Phycisphaerae bacterium]